MFIRLFIVCLDMTCRSAIYCCTSFLPYKTLLVVGWSWLYISEPFTCNNMQSQNQPSTSNNTQSQDQPSTSRGLIKCRARINHLPVTTQSQDQRQDSFHLNQKRTFDSPTEQAERLVKRSRVENAASNSKDNVTIPIPLVDRGRGDPRNIMGVILDRGRNDMYRITVIKITVIKIATEPADANVIKQE